MLTQSDHELVRAIEGAFEPETQGDPADAHELLQDHEFTLEGEDVVPAVSLLPNKRGMSPPPPPPRRRPAVNPRGRNISGIFPLLSIPSGASEAVVDAQVELQRVRAQMRARDAYLRELEHALATSTRQLSAAGLESAEDVARLLGRVRGQAFRIAELEAEVRALNTSLAQQRNASRPSEELQRVRGIGRRFAEQLCGLGFGSLARIAACTNADVALIAKHLRITRERVVRERWVEQASLLVRNTSADLEA
jgi:predicted flap endonuclease-1-like 5' DNA nuclease